VFNPLNKEHLTLIIDIQLERVSKLLETKGIHLEVTNSAKDVLMAEGYDPAYGARPMRRAIQRLIQDPLSLRLLSGDFAPGDTVVVERDGAKHALEFTRRVMDAVTQ
jgi:ATP-dependent Clp protease ATP-binding subunit ClpA